jgi:hypothetical protein
MCALCPRQGQKVVNGSGDIGGASNAVDRDDRIAELACLVGDELRKGSVALHPSDERPLWVDGGCEQVGCPRPLPVVATLEILRRHHPYGPVRRNVPAGEQFRQQGSTLHEDGFTGIAEILQDQGKLFPVQAEDVADLDLDGLRKPIVEAHGGDFLEGRSGRRLDGGRVPLEGIVTGVQPHVPRGGEDARGRALA